MTRTGITKMTKKTIFRFRLMGYLLLLALPVLAMAAEAANRPSTAISDIDWVLVVVNDDIITQSELNARVNTAKKHLELSKITAPPENILKKQVLEHMVLEQIQLQMAKLTGIQVSDAKIEEAVTVIAERNNMGLEEFYKTLAYEGIEPTNFKEQIRDQIIIKQLVKRDINNRISVSENEVESFLQNREGTTASDTSFNISHIMIAIPDTISTATAQEAKKRIADVFNQLMGGLDFAQAAVAYSQGPNALKGGSLGWKQAGQLPELFLNALAKLEPGAMTEVLRSPNGFHILKLNDIRGGALKKTVTQTYVRHILLKPSEIQSEQQARTRLWQLKERIENGEDFATLTRAYSEDTTTALSGGDLGWVNPGQSTPKFEQTMNALKLKELSQPTKTSYGLHLIQVMERREQDISQDLVRAGAREQIHARKADEKYGRWVRQLRDEAYVEYLGDDFPGR